jgi:hypothetical protein
MDRTTGGVSTEAFGRFRDGLSEHLTADGARRLLESVDSESILDEALAEDVPTEEGARIVGRLLGRVVAKEATSYLPMGQVVEATVGRAAGEKIGEGAVSLLIEYGSLAAILARIGSTTDSDESEGSESTVGSLAIKERASSARERLPEVPEIGTTETVWEVEAATSIPITEERETE